MAKLVPVTPHSAKRRFGALSGHIHVAGTLPGLHRDPFDRMLTAQALLEDMVLVSNERPFDDCGVTRLW